MMAVRWDRKIIGASVGRGILTNKMFGTVSYSPVLYAHAIGRPVPKGAGFGMTPCRMRRNVSSRVSTPERAVMAGSESACASVEFLLEADDAAGLGAGEDVGDGEE